MLSKLKIDGCKGLVCSTLIDSKSVKCMTISSSLDTYGCKGMLYSSPTDSLSPISYTTTTNILEFGKMLQQGLEEVETLEVGESQRIKSTWEVGFFRSDQAKQGLHVVTQIDEASIEEHCISIVSFPEVNFLPKNIRSLKIENSRALKSLPEEMMGNDSQLEKLYIGNCDSLTFIARRKLPSSLRRLYVWSCKKLQCLIDGKDDSAAAASSSSVTLKQLRIVDCLELTSLASGIQSFEALGYLHIFNCPKLESIPDGLHNFNCVRTICIRACPSLVPLPEDLQKLNSLQYLCISQYVAFPEKGLPTNLTSLEIGDVKVYEALVQWGLHRLTSLTKLYLGRGCPESFPNEEMGMILPTSLTRLTIVQFQRLKYLSSMSFQSLNSLKSLWILNCPKLASFPEAGLPSSLMELCMRNCPLLKEQCKRDKGKEWSKISQIPCVRIDGQFIYDLEEE